MGALPESRDFEDAVLGADPVDHFRNGVDDPDDVAYSEDSVAADDADAPDAPAASVEQCVISFAHTDKHHRGTHRIH